VLIIGLDIGTTSVKGMLVNENGEIVFQSSEEISLISPKPGWAEEDPMQWWNATEKVLFKLSEFAHEKNEEIKAIATSGQMHSLVLVDSKGNVLTNSILWCDQRTYKECNEITLKLGGKKEVISVFGNSILPGFTAPKILWIKRNFPDILQKTYKFMLPKDFINFKLTGQIFTEPSDASGTALYDIKKGFWAIDKVKELGFNPGIFPEIIPSNGLVGRLKEDIANKLRLSPDVKVISGGADNACAALGIGVVSEGQAMVSLGTSGTVFAPVQGGEPDADGKLHFFEHVVSGEKYYMGVMLSATHTLNWFNEITSEKDLIKINECIENIPIGANGVIVLPYLNGERTPHNDPYARAVFFGMSSSHNKWDIYRAIFEGVAYGIKDSFNLIEKFGIEINDVRITGGGSRSKIWRQILADVIGVNVKTMMTNEGAAYGAAMLAYSGFNNIPVVMIVEKWIKTNEFIKANNLNTKVYNKYWKIYQKLYKKNKELFIEINKIMEEKK